MSDPLNSPFDFSNVDDAPVTEEWGVPQSNASRASALGQSKLDSGPPLTLKERAKRFVGDGSDKRPAQLRKPRNVKLPKEKANVPNIPGQFTQPLTDLYNLIGVVTLPFEPEFGMTMLGPSRAPKEDEKLEDVPTVAENCARTLDEAAQRSESVRRALHALTAASVWGGVIAAHAPLAAVLLRNHGPWASKDGQMGPAEAMEAMLRQQAEQQQGE